MFAQLLHIVDILMPFIRGCADICVLIITIYTFYLTKLSNQLKFCGGGRNYTTFWGNTLSATFMNNTLHAIAISEVVMFKEVSGKFYKLSMVKYDDPLIIEPWQIKKIKLSYTDINKCFEDNSCYEDSIFMMVINNNRIKWVIPYRANIKSIIRLIKAYFSNKHCDYETVAVHKAMYEGKLLSKRVSYAIKILSNNNPEHCNVRTIFAIINKEDFYLSDYINGHNAIKTINGTSAKDLQEVICSALHFSPNEVHVVDLEPSKIEMGNDKITIEFGGIKIKDIDMITQKIN